MSSNISKCQPTGKFAVNNQPIGINVKNTPVNDGNK